MISGLNQSGRSVVGAATAVVTMMAKVKLHDGKLSVFFYDRRMH